MLSTNNNNVKKGESEPFIDTVDHFNLKVDQLIHFEGSISKEIAKEDKSTREKLRSIDQLEEFDKQALFPMIKCMFSKNK